MSHVRTPLYPVLLLPHASVLQSVQLLLSLIDLHEPLRGLQGILLRGQLERDGRLFALRLDEHALLVLPGYAGDDGKVERGSRKRSVRPFWAMSRMPAALARARSSAMAMRFMTPLGGSP